MNKTAKNTHNNDFPKVEKKSKNRPNWILSSAASIAMMGLGLLDCPDQNKFLASTNTPKIVLSGKHVKTGMLNVTFKDVDVSANQQTQDKVSGIRYFSVETPGENKVYLANIPSGFIPKSGKDSIY